MFLFVFLRRRLGSWFALASVAVLPLADYTLRYAIEARAYMLLLGVSAIALVCWQSAASGRSRFAPVGLALSVATALLLHVWAILLPFALAGGRGGRARALAPHPLARHRWLLRGRASALAILSRPAARVEDGCLRSVLSYEPTLDKLYTAWRSDVPRPRVIAAMLWPSLSRRGGRAGARLSRVNVRLDWTPRSWRRSVALLLSPLVPFVYAELNAGAFMTRYALFALPATVSLIGAVLCAVGGGRVLAGQSAAVVAIVGVWLYLPPKIPIAGSQSAALESLTASSASLDASVPLVLVNPVDVLAFDDQASRR